MGDLMPLNRSSAPQRMLYILLRVLCAAGLVLTAGVVRGSVLRADGNEATVCAVGCDYSTVQAAVDGMTPGSDTIIRIMDLVHTEYGILVDKAVTIAAPTGSSGILQAATAADSSPERVITVAAGATVTVQDLTIRHGVTSGSTAKGGGVLNEGNLTLNRVTLTTNRVEGTQSAAGAGIWNAGALTMTGSAVMSNTAIGENAYSFWDDGGSARGGGIASEGNLFLDRVTVEGNTAAGGYGFLGGWASGAGIWSIGSFLMTNSTVAGNSGMAGDGKAEYAGSAEGGGLYCGASDTVAEAVNSTFSGNLAKSGEARG